MRHQLSKVSKLVAAIKPTTAATTLNAASGAIDTSGFLSARALCMVGATTGDGVITLSITGSTASAGSYNTLTGTTTATVVTTTGLQDGILAVDVTNFGPNRYIKANAHRNGGNMSHGGVIVELYNPTSVPTTDDSTSMLVAQKVVVEAT